MNLNTFDLSGLLDSRVTDCDYAKLFLDIDKYIEEVACGLQTGNNEEVYGLFLSVFNLLRNIIHTKKESWEELDKKQKKEYYRIVNNFDWASVYLYRYMKSKDKINNLTDLKNCKYLLETAIGRRIVMKAMSGYTKAYLKMSRNKYCSWSMDMIRNDRKKELYEGMEYLSRKGYTIRMLTLSPKNLKHIEAEDLNNMQRVLKEFWRYREYVGKKKVFDMATKIYGYWGVPELKYNEETSYNLHYHFMILGKKNTGYIDKKIISRAWKTCCDKFGNDKIKGSFMKNIGAKHLNEPDDVGKEAWQKGVHYITKYLSKTIDIDNSLDMATRLKVMDHVVDALKGRDMIKRGGLLKSQRTYYNIMANRIEKGVGCVRDEYISLLDNGVDSLNISGEYMQSMVVRHGQTYIKRMRDNKTKYINYGNNKGDNRVVYIKDNIVKEVITRQNLKTFSRLYRKKYKLCPVSGVRMHTDSELQYVIGKSQTDLTDVNNRIDIINSLSEYVIEGERERFIDSASKRLSDEEFILKDLYKFSLEYKYNITSKGNMIEVS